MSRITKLNASISLIFVLGVLAASQAAAAEFHSEVAHVPISAEQHAGEDTVTFNAGTFRCNQITYTGTASSATNTTLRVTPTYSGCRAFGFVNSVIDVNGCAFVFSAPSNAASIECPAGQTMATTAFNCWITTGPQGPLSTVTYTNQGSGSSRDLTVDLNITGIVYTQHSKSFPGCTNGTFNAGTHSGAFTAKGADTLGNQVGIWVQ